MLMCFHKKPDYHSSFDCWKCPRTAFSKDGTRACRSQATDLAKGHYSSQYDCLQHCTSQRMIVSFSRSSMDIKFDPNGNRTLPNRLCLQLNVGYFIKLSSVQPWFIRSFSSVKKDFLNNRLTLFVKLSESSRVSHIFVLKDSRHQSSNNSRKLIKLFTREKVIYWNIYFSAAVSQRLSLMDLYVLHSYLVNDKRRQRRR